MKKYPFYILVISAVGFAACSEEPPAPIDNSVPVIAKLDSSEKIEPYQGQVVPSDGSILSFYFKVKDPEGIKAVNIELAGDFERQKDSPYADKFELLNYSELLDAESYDPRRKLKFGLDELNFDAFSVEWSGIYSVAKLPILAGPYELTIAAEDVNGNQSSFDDASSYTTTVFIDRWYAPVIHRPHGLPAAVSGESGKELSMEGGIMRTDVQESTPLKFVWIKLADRDALGGAADTADQVVFEERVWGESLRLEKKGESLPSLTQLTFNQLFESDPIILPTGQSDLTLIVWAEDEAGNVSRKSYTIDTN